jgi:hypothetical protein
MLETIKWFPTQRFFWFFAGLFLPQRYEWQTKELLDNQFTAKAQYYLSTAYKLIAADTAMGSTCSSYAI